MGQYYFPISLDKGESLCSHDYDNGLKLMEHSWLNNKFVKTVESLLAPGGVWHKTRLAWAGDYADPEESTVDARHPEGINLYAKYREARINPEEGKEFYRYIFNHTKMVYVDKTRIGEDGSKWRIHPLPLLTCEGNDRGGGDFHRPDIRVGYWARDVISVGNEVPAGEGWQIIDATFIER